MKKTIDGLVRRDVVKNTTHKTTTEKKSVTKKSVAPKTVEKNTPVTVKKAPNKKAETKKPKHENKIEKVELKKEEAASDSFLEPVKAFDLDVSSDEIKDEVKAEQKELKKRKKKEKKPRKKWVKIIEIVALVIVSLLIIGVIWLLIWGNDLIAKLTGGNSDIWSTIGVLTTETYEPLKADENGRTNILIFGTSGYDMAGSEGKGQHAGAQLTDSIMVVSLDQETGDIAMLSLPRDLKVSRACSAGKINEVYWCANQKGNNEEAGAKALQASVSEVLGVDFQYYVHVNWMSLKSIVDLIGGITVTLDEDVNDRSYTGAVIKAGVPTQLNGDQAVGLARARHGTAGGDFSRGNSQQKILIAIKDKLLENGVDFAKALQLLNTLGDNVRTDFSVENMKTGVHIAKDLDMSTIRQINLVNWKTNEVYMKTATINGISYVIPSAGAGVYGDIQKLVAKQFSSNPVVREDANILVLNGGGVSGAAATLKTSLEKDGYKVGKADNAPEGEYPKSYYIYNISGDKTAGTAKALAAQWNIGISNKDKLPSAIDTKGYDIVVIIGGKKETTE